MDARAILNAHIEALDGELEQAREGLRRIDDSLGDRVRSYFDREINNQLQELGYVQDDIDKGKPLDKCWASFRRKHEKCQPILKECFVLTQGALARGREKDDSGLDGNLCRIADFLLDGLSDLGMSNLYGKWGRFTILAEGEFFGEMAAVIRLRYPGANIWNLPVAAHEFGHFVVWQMEEERKDGGFENYVQTHKHLLPQPPSGVDDTETLKLYKDKQRMFLHEYYADIFATYALGPAYAYTCLLLRFDPRTAYEDWSAHPSARKRAHAILKTLEEMNQVKGSEEFYSGIIERLRCWWERSVEDACPSEESAPDDDKLGRIEKLVEELHHRLDAKMPHVRYSGWPQAVGLYERMKDRKSTPALKPEDKLRDVFNAAWLCRINASDGNRQSNDDVLDVLDNRAKALCEGIVARSLQEPRVAV